MIFRMLLISLLFSSFGFCDVIIMKNGQKVTTPGSYTVQGKFIRYRDQDGELLQLPVSLVDLDASKKATQLAKDLANKVVPVKKKVPEKRSLSEIAKDLDRFREEDYQPPQQVSIDSKGMEKYHQENENSVHPDGLLAPDKPGLELEKMGEKIKGEYNRLADEIDRLDKEIEKTKKAVIGFQNESNFGDDPTGAAYDNLERTEKHLEELKAQRSEKFKHLQKVKAEARDVGDKSIARKRPIKKMKKEESGRDDLKYESSDDEFKYDEDSPN